MISIISTILSTILLLHTLIKSKNKKSLSPHLIFYLLWTFILFLSSLNLYNISKPNDEAYILIDLMLLFYGMGVFCFEKYNKKHSRLSNCINIKKQNADKIYMGVFYFLSILIIFFYILDIIVIVEQLNDNVPMWQIRNWTLQPYGSDNPILNRRSFIEESLRSIILGPFSLLIPPITAYTFFNSDNNKKRFSLLGISILNLLLSSIAGGGGRLGFIYYFSNFLLAFFIFYKSGINSKKLKSYKKIIILLFCSAAILMIAMTSIRAGFSNIFKQVYTYFALPPTLLSKWLPTISSTSRTYGLTTTFGIYSYIFRVFNTLNLDFLVPNVYYDVFNHILDAEIFLDVGYGVGNAFVTPIYYFMIDGGYLFVCVASFAFGFMVSKFYDKFEHNIGIKGFCSYILVCYGVFLTFMRIQTAIPSYIISFIMIYFIFDNKYVEWLIQKKRVLGGKK